MRPIRFSGQPSAPGQQQIQWILNALGMIQTNSNIDAMVIAAGYTVKNYTPTRTLNAGTATLADVANVLATILADLKAQGASNG